jgi:hypothetical protein
METTQQAYKAKMTAQLARWSARIEELKAQAGAATADATTALRAQLDELMAFEAIAKQHLAKVEAFAADGWQMAKAEIEDGWDRLSGSVEAICAKLAPESTH